ncbi:MAG TPA: hypothetical protein VKY74_24420 [Chloroflexia bacterium]|nr:hypothetical protein [Chloroflexia bacterium]
MARAQGARGRAIGLYEESLGLLRALGVKPLVALVLHNLGLAVLPDQPGRAAALFAESLRINQDLGDQRAIAECLAGLVGVAAYSGQPARAVRLAGAAAALLAQLGTCLEPADQRQYDQALAAAQARLDPAARATAWAAGQALSCGQAAAYAQAEADDRP